MTYSKKYLRRDRGPGFVGALAALVVGAVVGWGCSLDRLESSAPLEEVAGRLGASAFSEVPVPLHGPVAQIGDEAREVVVAPESVLVAEALGVVPENGNVRVDVELPPTVRALPDAAFVLTTQELSFTQPLPADVATTLARRLFSKRPTRGWRLRRSPDDAGRAVLEFDHQGESPAQLNLRLSALLPPPEQLESDAFTLPAGARMALGFGLAVARTKAPRLAVEFTATLACTGQPVQVLVRERVSLDDPGAYGWHDVSVASVPASDCRLRLANRTSSGGPPWGAVWASPQILTPGSDPSNLNLIVVSLDTLRADHLSGYGYSRETSPAIDALIERGTVFTDVSSTFPETDVSHLSIFTGLYPSAQPIPGRVSAQDRLVLLAEILQRAGFETAAFTEDGLLSGGFGFWFGFDRFTERSFAHEKRGRQTIDDGIAYLREHRNRRFFLFLHTYKTHAPYVSGASYASLWSDGSAWSEDGPAPFVPRRSRDRVDRYDRTIREADALVADLLGAVESLRLTERTIIVLLSDHGEAFGEHGVGGHGLTPHVEELSVPLILYGPGVPSGLQIDAPVSLADVTPSLLDLLGLGPVDQSQGVSFKPALEGRALDDSRPLFFSWVSKGAIGVRVGHRKFHRSDKGHVTYDLADDPRERKPIGSGRPPPARESELLAAHQAESAHLRDTLAGADGSTSIPGIGERLEKSLEALGYL